MYVVLLVTNNGAEIGPTILATGWEKAIAAGLDLAVENSFFAGREQIMGQLTENFRETGILANQDRTAFIHIGVLEESDDE